jgi:hypothetical protein
VLRGGGGAARSGLMPCGVWRQVPEYAAAAGPVQELLHAEGKHRQGEHARAQQSRPARAAPAAMRLRPMLAIPGRGLTHELSQADIARSQLRVVCAGTRSSFGWHLRCSQKTHL